MASLSQSLAALGAVNLGIQSMPAMSSFIALFEYDQQNLTLTTHFKSGAIYQSKFVLPADWTALQTSQNHGKHWSNNISRKKASVRVKTAKAPKSELKNRRKS